jgi:hypothetical protein
VVQQPPTRSSTQASSPHTAATPAGTRSNTDLARGRPVSADSATQGFGAANTVDGSTSTYWESTDGTANFPHHLTVDLGSPTSVSRAVLSLPPDHDWGSRNQTLAVKGSTNGSSFSTIVGSASYTFDAATGNHVTIDFSAHKVRYVQLYFTANTYWPAAQLSEISLY